MPSYTVREDEGPVEICMELDGVLEDTGSDIWVDLSTSSGDAMGMHFGSLSTKQMKLQLAI